MKQTRFQRRLRAHALAEWRAFQALDCCIECLTLATDAAVRGIYASGMCSACGQDWRDPAAARWLRECYGVAVMEQAA